MSLLIQPVVPDQLHANQLQHIILRVLSITALQNAQQKLVKVFLLVCQRNKLHTKLSPQQITGEHIV